MTSRKNVIFIGMTQNGKSSLVQQILRYAGEFEKALAIGIGTGNFSETQTCSLYDVELPLKTHRLRQIEGSDEERNGEHVEPGTDFELDDAGDFTLAEDVEDSGERLQLKLIDTPGLSDSGNSISSMSGMKVIDERHKLRILLTLQEVEDIHAICFVVRRDTNYGGDFQELVKRMISLISFCVRSTAWNLQYHIVHTNIDVDDRAAGLCEVRQQEFDEFGPAGAIHHFLDNQPDRDFPLDTFFTNYALSNLFRSLASDTPTKFSSLHYPKSPEHECNDQILISAAQRAITELLGMVDESSEKIANLTQEISRHEDAVKRNKKRIDDYDEKIAELDRYTDSEVDSEEGWTEKNLGGGGGRLFSLYSKARIANVEKKNDGDGDWVSETRKEHSYQVTLQPHWLHKAYGTVKLYASKREKHSAKILELKTEKAPVVTRREKFELTIADAKDSIATEECKITNAQRHIAALERDAATVRTWGHSISLAHNKKMVKFFTVDSPLSAAMGYKLLATVPWMVASLKKLPILGLKEMATVALKEAAKAVESSTGDVKKAASLFAMAEVVKVVIQQLRQSPLGIAKAQSSAIVLVGFLRGCRDLLGIDLLRPDMQTLLKLKTVLAIFSGRGGELGIPRGLTEYTEEDIKALVDELTDNDGNFINFISEGPAGPFKMLQQDMCKEIGAKAALACLNADGLPIGVFASLVRAQGRGDGEPFLAILSEFREVSELAEMALDE